MMMMQQSNAIVKGAGVPLDPSIVAGGPRDERRCDVDIRALAPGRRQGGPESSNKAGRFLILLAALSGLAGCFYFGLWLGAVWGGLAPRDVGATGVRKERPAVALLEARGKHRSAFRGGPRDGGLVEVPVYVAEGFANPALSGTPYTLSAFRTGILEKYGSGRLKFTLVDHSMFECHKECLQTREPLILNRALVGEAKSPTHCLVIGREDRCKLKHLQCNYPNCATLVTNNERCTAPAAYDAREYYTADLPDKGYLLLGPRLDAWSSFKTISSRSKPRFLERWAPSPEFEIQKASERKYAFNAVFSQSTNDGRKKLAALIKEMEGKNSSELEVWATMARKWTKNVNSRKSKQLHTDEYARVVFDSVFTLAPAGHNPECFRLYEAVEGGSIPILVEGDLYQQQPCRHSLVHWFGAPIVVLRTWEELYPTVAKLMENSTALDERQAELRAWYVGFMTERVRAFEDFVMGKERARSSLDGKAAGTVDSKSLNITTQLGTSNRGQMDPSAIGEPDRGKIDTNLANATLPSAIGDAWVPHRR